MRPRLAAMLFLAAGAGVHAGSELRAILNDAQGDASPHRTDPGMQGAIMPGANVDLLSVVAGGWSTPTPISNPYSGVFIEPRDASLLRIDVTFDGLVNPPGTLGLAGLPFNPFRFGPNPVLGYVEFDADNDRDTGGDLSTGAAQRFMANVGRFGERPEGSHSARAPKKGSEVDFNFFTSPQYERSGVEFELVFCGCFDPVIHARLVGDQDDTFEPGEVWIVRGRFFQRAQGFQAASAAFGGSAFGLYDPIVDLRFAHDITTNQTTVSLVYPLTMQGAALLTGQAVQPMDLNVANHTSVAEAIQDVIDGAIAGGLPVPTHTITNRWANKDVEDAIRVDQWRISALLGTSYLNPQLTLFVWTDVAGESLKSDFDASGIVAAPDIADWTTFVAGQDGSLNDCDGVVNGSVQLCGPGTDWSLYDLNYDGFLNGADAALITPSCPGDTNADLRVDFADLNNVLSGFGQQGPPAFAPGDLNADGRVDFFDLNQVLSSFGAVCPPPLGP